MAEPSRQRIGDLLSACDRNTDAWRQSELALLETCLADAGPLVAWIQGPDGRGKSSLLRAFCERAETGGAATLRIDCRTVEPTAAGLLGAVILFTLALLSERTTRKALQNSGALNAAALNQADAAVRNAEVIDAMGMLGALTARWRRDTQEGRCPSGACRGRFHGLVDRQQDPGGKGR